MRRSAVFPVLALLAACGPGPPPQTASLPPDAHLGAGDDTRSAILTTASAFASPNGLANRPADAARAIAQLEYLAVELPNGPRWRAVDPTVAIHLAHARDDARAALGIASGAPPQAVIDGLYGISRALVAGDRAAAERNLNPAVFQGGSTATLQRLATLPPLPRANHAAVLAQFELYRVDRQDNDRGDGGGAHP